VDYKGIADPYHWILAKMFFCLAEAQVHKIGSLYTETLCITESIAMCMYRNLPSMHPLFKLMEPYIESSIYVNDYARKYILPDLIKRGLAVSIEGAEQLISYFYKSYNFSEKYFPTDMARRGVNDSSKLPYYPYRDLGGLMFDEILKMVSAFVRHYYKSSDLVKRDRELNNFITSLTTEAKIGGVPKCTKIPHLISIITHIIFTSTVQFSVSTGSQYYYNGFIPNSPSILSLHPPRVTDKVTLETIINGLPDFDLTFFILCQTNLFSPNSTLKLLSHYQNNNFKDNEVQEILNQFRAQLKMMGNQMEQHSFSVVSPSKLRIGWDI